MKKWLSVVLFVLLVLNLSLGGVSAAIAEEKTLKVVTTIFPIYDWVDSILGEEADHVELSMLVNNGVDLHSYQATTQDMMSIAQCDLFIYVGGESDAWVEDVLEAVSSEHTQVINLMDVLGDAVKAEEMVEGMQASAHNHEHEDEDADHDHDHEDEDADHDHEHDHEVENDEHVWLSLRNAQTICESILSALETVDGEYAQTYAENANAYIQSLKDLDAEYVQAVENASVDTILVGDRFPLRYLVDDYDLNYYAAFVGCSAETEASFETVIFLAEKVDECGLQTVLTMENSDQKIANTVISNTKNKDQKVLVLNSMQASTLKDHENGVTYLSIMQDNLDALKQALGSNQ